MYAKGTHSVGICDRCGAKVPYLDLRSEVIDGLRQNNMVCFDCFDIDHPQYRVGKRVIVDRMALYNARPENFQASRSFFGWNPVGNVTSNTINISVGRVTVRVE